MLRMEGISKRFGTGVALDKVDFSVGRGEIHALVGENGAGKSTLVKILTGAYRRDEGSVHVDDRAVVFDSPAGAQAGGVCAVHQEIALLGYRTVSENLYLGREPRRWGLVDWARMHADAHRLLSQLGMDVDARATLSSLNAARQQMVAIARGVSLDAKVLVLDEPTSSLSQREVAILHGLVRQLATAGTAVIYISHRLDELFALCDSVTVLRDGKLVARQPMAGLDRLGLICQMLGKSREAVTHGATGFDASARAAERQEVVLSLDAVVNGTRLRGMSLEVDRGEIAGLAGLLGSGRTETARVIFGADRPDAGTMALGGIAYAPASPRDAIRSGVGFVSEDRKAEGIFPHLSVQENMTLAALPTLSRHGIVSRSAQHEVVTRFMKRLGIKAMADQPIGELSGGNQQKVLLARWMCLEPRLLLLDEPTRGIDVGARMEVQHLIDELSRSGMAVLMISSELEELVEGSSRVTVMRDGRAAAELNAGDITEGRILAAMAGADA